MTVTMAGAVKKRTAPQEWIQDYYSPLLTVLAHDDVETIANKNNLTFTELLQPFSKMLTDVTIKDVDGANHNVPALNIVLQDFKKDPHKQVNQKLMLDRVGEENVEEKDLISKHFPKITIEAPGYTPWFDTWMKLYLASLPTVDHEYLKHHLGCIFAVSTTTKDPVEALRSLVSMQQRAQHERTGPNAYPQYFVPNILKYFVLVHDSYSPVDDAAAAEIFTKIQNAFEPTFCHFLQVNSRSPNPEEPDPPPMAEHWFGFTHRWCSLETRRGTSMTSGMATKPPQHPRQEEAGEVQGEEPAHPLASSGPESLSPGHSAPIPRLTQATPASVARLLSPNDIDRVRMLIRDLTIKALIPWVEKQLKHLHEVVTNRKSRSLFSGAKRWFGTNKGSPSGGTSVVYSREAPELQVRKLADLYFLMRMYKPAYNYAYISKKDFQTDEAWPYYAAAAELAALCMFMLSSTDPGKKYRPDYMEDAIAKYLTLCQAPEFAVRATLFDGLCLKQQGMFVEAATSYIKMTNELSDLRSALLLEQAAYCFLLAQPASTRKYGFHIVLAGYRFSKTGGCKRHAARLYKQGAQVYEGGSWQLSAEHILYTLGHTKFMLKDFTAAAEFFNSLMEGAVGEVKGGHLQQMVHLREYFLVHHARAKETGGGSVVVTVPRVHGQLTKVDVCPAVKPSQHQLKLWQPVEKLVKEVVSGKSLVSLSATCQTTFDNSTPNHLNPQARVGEQLEVTINLENTFSTPLQLRNLQLLFKFESEGEGGEVTSSPIESVTLERNSKQEVRMQFKATKPGVVVVQGVEYILRALFPDKEPTDHEIKGKQLLNIVPRSVHVQKDRKWKREPGLDKRLEISILESGPQLDAKLEAPVSMLTGELKCLELHLRNIGSKPLDSLHLVSHTPGLTSFGKRSDLSGQSLFELPLIEDQGEEFRKRQEDGSVEQVSIEVVAIPLPETLGGALQPGADVKVPLWIKAPAHIGQSSHSLLLFYDSVQGKGKTSVRMTPITLSLSVQPSLEVSCSFLPLSHSSQHPGSQHRLSLVNATKELAHGLETLEVTQVTLVSRSLEVSSSPQCSSTGLRLSRGESNNFSFQSVISEGGVTEYDFLSLSQLPASVALDGGNVHFSSILAKSQEQPVQSPPFLDFLRHHFVYNLGRRGNPPLLRHDLCVVLWRTLGASPCLGHTVVEVVEQEQSPEGESKAEEKAAERPLVTYPVTALAEVGEVLMHDFTTTPLASVPVKVKVTGQSLSSNDSKSEEGALVQYCLGAQERGARVAGATAGLAWVSPSVPLDLDLGVSVARPGLYCLRNWQFRAVKLETCDMTFDRWRDDDVFVPLEITFEVRQI